MTTRPRLYTESSQVYGLLAVALFVVLAAAFLTASFGDQAGFQGVGSITAGIGYAMFDIQTDAVPANTESFLAAFEIIDVVLVAALAGAVMLGRRDDVTDALGGRD